MPQIRLISHLGILQVLVFTTALCSLTVKYGSGDYRMDAQPRLLPRVRERLRTMHYSYRTEQQYIAWIRRFIHFHGMKHPACMGAVEVEAFLTHLAVQRNVSASTQSQALSALLFLYGKVLQVELPWLENLTRARKPRRLPVVLSTKEVRAVLAQLDGVYRIIAALLYGSGLRLMEALRLRVKDLDFEYRQVVVRDGKGAKDRVTVLPESLMPLLRTHLADVRARHEIAVRASKSPLHVIPSGTASPHTFWSAERTSAPFRSCSVTRRSPRPRSTLT